MLLDNKVYVGYADGEKVCINLSKANRHGIIAGATGTGKTTTLRVIAESFSDAGVPVFLADAKGDLATLTQPGTQNENVQKRVDEMGLAADGFHFSSYPVTFWDVYQEMGLPLRATVSEVGPLLLSRILGLNDTQSDIMQVIFKIADDEGILLIDTKDLRSMLTYVGENAKDYSLTYGNIAKQSLTSIIRAVIALEAEGGDMFFGEPALDIHDWLTCDASGKGKINILDCQKLMNNPNMYSTFMLWMMSELYETLPEVGDPEKPKIAFFFDEAHMLFDNASKELLQKIEQVVKLIRSKGVGIYFITQNPADIPEGILAQLGNKVQHALRAFTPAEQKKARAASDSFRVNPAFDTYETLLEMGTGEALISVLDESGVQTPAPECLRHPRQRGPRLPHPGRRPEREVRLLCRQRLRLRVPAEKEPCRRGSRRSREARKAGGEGGREGRGRGRESTAEGRGRRHQGCGARSGRRAEGRREGCRRRGESPPERNREGGKGSAEGKREERKSTSAEHQECREVRRLHRRP